MCTSLANIIALSDVVHLEWPTCLLPRLQVIEQSDFTSLHRIATRKKNWRDKLTRLFLTPIFTFYIWKDEVTEIVSNLEQKLCTGSCCNFVLKSSKVKKKKLHTNWCVCVCTHSITTWIAKIQKKNCISTLYMLPT